MTNQQFTAFLLIFCLTTVTAVLWSRLGLAQPIPIPGTTVRAASVPELFTAIPMGKGWSISTRQADSTVIRQRLVKANVNLLTRTTGQALRLNLFEDLAYNVTIERRRTSVDGLVGGELTSVQFGRIADIPQSEVYLTSRGHILSGNIRLPDGQLYEIRYLRSGVHAVREIDQNVFPEDPPPKVWEKGREGESNRLLKTEQWILDGNERPQPKHSTDISGGLLLPDRKQEIEKTIPYSLFPVPYLDVMVVYTSAARRAAGGTVAMNSLIDLAEMETNQGFANSHINLQIRIVHRQEVNYLESGSSSTDLKRLINPKDGFLDSLQSLRQLYKVDAVSLWVNHLDSCGLSRLMKSASMAFRDRAFSVVRDDCATGYYSFAHELGHNLGADHDIKHAQNGVYAYSHGYQDPDGEFRTIMAYKCPGGCQRRNYWSNPNLTLNGKPLGIADRADNVRTLNNTLSIAKAWDNPGLPGQCFARQVYWRGSYFSKDWIGTLRNKGYLITDLAERGQEWAVVLSQPLEYNEQEWVTEGNFPKNQIQSHWNEGRYITEVGTTKKRWLVVMSKPASYTRQHWMTSNNVPKDWIKQEWDAGNRITTIGARENQWAVVASNPTQYKKQRWSTEKQFPRNWIKAGWKKQSKITSIAATREQFAVVMSQPSRYDMQVWVTAQNFPDTWIYDQRKTGYQITGLAATDNRWAVVMSKCK
ncbi:MAG TPA: hypothetical protein DDZ80_09740 [Cyanobacteria bacterium UBA8803]|nr:hypothetical protein [Cyanobacteria bacterium UBA9273]HBL58776.1 hypothetical protein [Cyanobacteria bacterium UBA8803]